jgi:hypothetical protein
MKCRWCDNEASTKRPEDMDPPRDPGRVVLCDACLEDNARVRGWTPRVVIVPAPGDRCGNTRALPDGQPCPGCRACC